MITPLSIDDVDKATDEEIIAAYLDEGVAERAARWYLAVIRGTASADRLTD